MSPPVAKQKPTTPRKDRRVEFRADPVWYDQVEAAANELGISVAAYLRVAAIEKIKRDRTRPEGTER